MQITFLLPTCEPNTMFRFLLPSIHYLKPVKQLLEFNIIFQPPYTKKEIKRVLNEFKQQRIKVKYMYKNYRVVKPFTPLIKMRNDCAMMSPNSDIYGLLDDDMSFESPGICNYIRLLIDKFKKNKNLGVVSFYNQETNYRENFYSTNAGLFYRGGKYYGFKGLIPKYLTDFNTKVNTRVAYSKEDLINLVGGHQDKFCAMVRLATGQTGICIGNVPVNHLENRKNQGAKDHGWDAAKYIDGSIGQFIVKYFNRTFLDDHALTLFDEETNKKIYPYRYEHDFLKEEYDLYDERGILYGWFSNMYELRTSKYWGGNPYKPKSAKSIIHWKVKRYTKYLEYLEHTKLINELPPEIISSIKADITKIEDNTRTITVFSVDYFGRNIFKRDEAKQCYKSWYQNLALILKKLNFNVEIKIFDPRWDNLDLLEFNKIYETKLRHIKKQEHERLFILYILSKYNNHIYLSPDNLITTDFKFNDVATSDSNWKFLYNKDSLASFKQLFVNALHNK